MAEVKIITLDLLDEYNKLSSSKIKSDLDDISSDFHSALSEVDTSIKDQVNNLNISFNDKFITINDSLIKFSSINTSIINKIDDLPHTLLNNGFLTSSNLSSAVAAAGCILADKTELNTLIETKITNKVPSWAMTESKPIYTAKEVGALSVESNTETQVQNIIDSLDLLDQKLAEYDAALNNINNNFTNLSNNMTVITDNVSLLSSKVSEVVGSSIALSTVSTPVIATIHSSVTGTVKPVIAGGGTYKRKTSL